MDVINHSFEKIKAGLPKQYAKLIAAEIPGMKANKVRNVFAGRVTDPTTVLEVVEAAKRLRDKTDQIKEGIAAFV